MKNSEIILPDELKHINDWFWDIISKAKQDENKLRKILEKMDKDAIYDFQDLFIEAAVELRCQPFTDFTESSEDGIDDISNWVVSKGKAYYVEILDYPERIPYSVEDKTEEIIAHVADEVYFEKFGETTGLY
ncbi:DUF4240 domain-containing protein [Flavobacterium tyrosinilyticum]|uniref:DUF4240 domain-containing protein n=1 Tax=Flavobacterium tyrosinilyticum TaxID=1658740 RepID=UPI0020308386|nr:DUF4240 domain-containing protein [Flavobacterium tyrosinilyticum]MCM0665621.1 DUF4240 domain-containing protein [Flavobacterium tyrosinilyticum]